MVHDTINALYIQFPRLVRLVRRARELPESSTARSEAVALAVKLYMLDLGSWVQKAQDIGLLTIVPTVSPEYSEALPVSFAFTSFLVSRGCISYWALRVLVCGLILALSEIVPAMPEMHVFDLETVAAEDLRAAERIAMCYDYSIQSSTPIPLNSIRLLMPIQTAFGAWYREGRHAAAAGVTAGPKGEHARRMMDMSVQMMNGIGGMWGGRGESASAWMRNHDIMMGGPLPDV